MCPEFTRSKATCWISAGDLIAQDAKYHLQCNVTLCNSARETKHLKNLSTCNEVMELHLLNYSVVCMLRKPVRTI